MKCLLAEPKPQSWICLDECVQLRRDGRDTRVPCHPSQPHKRLSYALGCVWLHAARIAIDVPSWARWLLLGLSKWSDSPGRLNFRDYLFWKGQLAVIIYQTSYFLRLFLVGSVKLYYQQRGRFFTYLLGQVSYLVYLKVLLGYLYEKLKE